MVLLTINDAAMIVNRHPRQIYRWIESGKLEAVLDIDGTTKVDGAEVMALEPKVRRGRPQGTARPGATRRNNTA